MLSLINRLRKYIIVVPIIEIIFLILALILVVLGQYLLVVVLLLLIILINGITESFSIHIKRRKNRLCNSLRIMTYNLNRAYDYSVNRGTSCDLIRFINGQNADILLLQEYNSLLYPEIVESLLVKYPYSISSESCNNRYKDVFSKYPISTYEQLWADLKDVQFSIFHHEWYSQNSDGEREILPICSMVINVGEIKIRVVNCHLMSNNLSVVIRDTPRNFLDIMKSIPNVFRRVDFGYSARKIQGLILVDHLSQVEEKHIIVCGDFNDVGGSSTLNPFKKIGLCDCWWNKGFGFGFTFHGLGIKLRLDHILFSRKTILLEKAFVPHSNCSDHYPVVADMVLI